MTGKHSPIPWKVGDEIGHETGLFAVQVLFANGPHVGISGPADALVVYSEQAYANAAHIVRCVNLHDDLVAALDEAYQFIQRLGDASLAEAHDLIVNHVEDIEYRLIGPLQRAKAEAE